MEDVHRNGVGGNFTQGDSEFHELLRAFTHSDDAAAADLQADFTGGTESGDLFGDGMGGAQGSEMGWCGLDIAVNAFQSRVLEAYQLGFGQQSQRAAEVDAGMLPQRPQGGTDLFDLGVALAPSGSDYAEAHGPLVFSGLCRLQAALFTDPAPAVAGGMPVCGLGAPLAVFCTAAAAGVDDSAEIE